jgi:hypothetical protein
LERQPFEARMLAVFDHACDLVTTEGDVIALVTPDVGNGPLNIVVDARPGEFKALGQGTMATLQKTNLHIGSAQVDLREAEVWKPCPDWNVLRGNLDIITCRLPTLREITLRHTAVRATLVAALPGRPPGPPLNAGWDGDLDQLRQAATQLAGLGGGLTPAGDDFLCGVMLWAWLAHPAPSEFCHVIVEVAAPRTTTLSAAFLRSVAKGECSAAWHRLLNALASGSHDELDAATVQVLAHGATSGADTLGGFLALTL